MTLPTIRSRDVLRQIATALLVALATLGAAFAQDLPDRVGRLADLGGRVYLATEERADEWVEALRNYTVTSGDNLWTTDDGRAEIDYGGGQFRLAGGTNMHVARLDDQTLALFVAHGRVIVRIRVLDPGESARVDTPNTQVTLTRPGLYRIEVSPDPSRTTVVVREGEAIVAFVGGAQQVLPGQTAFADGREPSYAEVRNGYGTDGFDSWSANRDRRYERRGTVNYVSRQMIGYADLDEHGRWESSNEYGAIWYPTAVAVGWAPYRHGRWTWVGGFGWTWVDDAPWGYAPFHYGRWAFVGNRWGWCPGGYIARPSWAPAMVGWYGGAGWEASVSFGAPVFGWVPLAWGEPYLPSWRNCSDRCWTRYNRPYAVNYAERPSAPPTRYRNWSAPGGVTAVAGATFTGRHPVHANLVAVRPGALSGAAVLSQAPVLAKPTAATIPGAKPTVARVPEPAGRIYRDNPAPPAARAGTTTWGSGAPSAPGVTSVRPAPRTDAAPVQGRAPAATQPRPPSTSSSAPPAEQPRRAPTASTYSQGTWGAPAAPAQPGSRPSTSGSRSDQGGPQTAVPNRAEVPRAAPPASADIPMPRSAPPATQPQRASPPSPPSSAQPGAPVQGTRPPAPVPQAAPAPPPAAGSKPAAEKPAAEKPASKLDSDKPTVQR